MKHFRPVMGRNTVVVFVMALVSGLVALGLGAAPASAAGNCAIRWGSGAKVETGASGGSLVNVRAGRHACYDRMVMDIADGAGLRWWAVNYVDEVRSDGEGAVVPTRGGASLQVVVFSDSQSPDGSSFPGVKNPDELVNVKGFSTFRQVVWAGSFEGVSTVGIGTRARLPFRVFTQPGPRGDLRLVVDVAHRW